MTDTELLDLLESGDFRFSDLSKRFREVNGSTKLVWCYWQNGPGWIIQPTLRDCIRKLAELKEKKLAIVIAVAPDPTGGSSGTGRSKKHE